MSEFEFDFVVVGAGINGSWTAKELTKYGKVLLLEQFREPHTRGSSHGQSRLIRSGYQESFFADLMPHAFKMWRQAEAEMNEKLIQTTGVLCLADSEDSKELRDCENNMKRLCPEHLVKLSSEDIQSQYSLTLKYPKGTAVILDKSGGVVFAHKAVRTIQQWFQNSGGIMWDCCKVTKITPSENIVKIATCKGEVSAKSVVICAGPWTPQLLGDLAPSLPLEPQAVKVFYWKEKEPGVYSASSGFPALLQLSHPCAYAFPSLEYPGLVKVCFHGGFPVTNPDDRDNALKDPKYENILRTYIKEHLPLLEPEPAITETCMYTCTPDEIFVIDYLPGHKNIVLGAGFSGTGFKTSPAVGRLLSELARGEKPFLDLSPYRLSRFSAKV